MTANPFLVWLAPGTGPLARPRSKIYVTRWRTVPVASGCERIRSGGGGRRADSSRGGAGKTDLHTLNYKRGHPAGPTAYRRARGPALVTNWAAAQHIGFVARVSRRRPHSVEAR